MALSATYRQTSFIIPKALQQKTSLDTALLYTNDVAVKLHQLILQSSDTHLRAAVDSLQPPRLPSAYFDSNPTAQFALEHRRLCILSIKNDGDKGFSQLQIIHEEPAYYEYKDSNGKVQSGQSAGKFSIGDLAATETKEIDLWTIYNTGSITVVYSDGKFKAEEPTEVTGMSALLIENSFLLFQLLTTLLAVAIPLLLVWASRRRQAAVDAAIAAHLAQSAENTDANLLAKGEAETQDDKVTS